jgi:diguanylate cyclase (GGDEF)-like protein
MKTAGPRSRTHAIPQAKDQAGLAAAEPREHPRTIGWVGTTALAMGGANQSLFLIGAIVASQGSAAIPLLVLGLLLSYAAAPGWTELILMWPKRVGGIAATCAEAFRPYSPVLANLTGTCYWWGWVPTCGLTAILSASALKEWYLHDVSVPLLATAIIVVFVVVNLNGIRAVTRVAVPIAAFSALLALLSGLVPILAGTVDWHRAASFHLSSPFHGTFGAITSAMAGLYLIGFAAPAFEAAACHVGETIDPERNVPRAMLASGLMASVYFVLLPVVWLGVFGPKPLTDELMRTLGPTFGPLLGNGARAAAIWFMVLNMFHGTLQPLAGAARTLSQLSEDGLLPRAFGKRSRRDVPWVATLVTAGAAILFLQTGDPPWVIAAANFCYLIGIGLPSVAVWLLRRNQPEMERPYRAPRGTIVAGVVAACVWFAATLLGFEQFGLPTVIASLALAYAGAGLYALRRYSDHRRSGVPRLKRSLHFKLTGAMIAVMALDGTGYLVAVSHVDAGQAPLVAVLKDVFVAVAILTITVGLVLPGMIAHSAEQVMHAAARLANGTVAELTRALQAFSRGDLAAAHANAAIAPVSVTTRDELGAMAQSFNRMQAEVGVAAGALDEARYGLREIERRLERSVAQQAAVARLGRLALTGATVDDLSQEVAETIVAVLDVDAAKVHELTPDGRSLRARGEVGYPAGAGRGTDNPLDPRSPAAGVIRDGEPIVVPNWATERSFLPTRTLKALAPLSSALVPMMGRTTALGAVQADMRRRHDFAPDEIDFLAALANVLAEAIERLRVDEVTRHQALHDPLTGLPNRVLSIDRLAQALRHAPRRGTAVALLFVDLDQFKLVNDSLGHGIGDELLQAIAVRLSESLRPGDTIARFGGDEFVMLCEDLAAAEESAGIAERVLEVLGRPFTLGSGQHFVSASIGIATAEGAWRDPEDMIREADAAMYRAKARGRNRFELYDERMRSWATTRLQLENDLRRAIEREEIGVAFQPVISLADGSLVGVEALARWSHPERGDIPPADFIPIAEETGMIIPLGEQILRASCEQAVRWHRAWPGKPNLQIAVNLSARQVTQPGFGELVGRIVRGSGLPPERLSLEITETILLAEADAAGETLRELKRQGVQLVLDDFGTGYSSLAYVRRFPIDVLKIDQSFVADLGHSPDAGKLVEAVIHMAAALRVRVIAEGIETRAQAELLAGMGCRYGQGFYFSPPLDAPALEPLLAARPPAAAAV